ncbi:hypothetical protein [Bacillus cereus]|nr:hypothetical protein [Bacillus cereus]
MAIKKSIWHLRQGPEVLYTFIMNHRDEFLVVKICQVFGVLLVVIMHD